MRPHPCSVSLSIIGVSQLAWLLSLWLQVSVHSPFTPPDGLCVIDDRGVLRAWACHPDDAATALASSSDSNRLRAALGSLPCWWEMSVADFEALAGVGPSTAPLLAEIAHSGKAPTLFELDRVPRVGPATAFRIVASVTTECSRL
jgi:predicted metal-binding membrane protein